MKCKLLGNSCGMNLHIADSLAMKPFSAIDWNCRGLNRHTEPFLSAVQQKLTLSSVIPALSVLYKKTNSYIANCSHVGYVG